MVLMLAENKNLYLLLYDENQLFFLAIILSKSERAEEIITYLDLYLLFTKTHPCILMRIFYIKFIFN